jgi:8-oxo-dGTP pyrophosphatase MutT (NUDIX family)
MPIDAPIRIASTVMLVRQADELEVLMVKRNQQIDFFSGAMVFPGGKVEPGDLDPAWEAHIRGIDQVAEEERGPRIAASRETFEETGVLACAQACPSPAIAEDARARLEAGELSFLDFVRENGIVLDLTRLTLFARWLTPPVVPKRFDTFFYLIEMPAGQVVRHDGRETIENEWVTAREALRRGEAGERMILFPTRQNLRLLSQTSTIAEAVRAAGGRARRQVTPQIELRADGQRYLRLLPEDGYGEVFEKLAVGG